MRILKRIIVLILIIIILMQIVPMYNSTAVESTQEQINVLFIGNSKTYYNIFPRIFRNLVKNSTDVNVSMKIKVIVAGGRTLKQHAKKLNAIHDSNGDVNTYSKVSSKFIRELYSRSTRRVLYCIRCLSRS